ncbi:hypothetical protein KKG72_04145 [bacterium]|nr:hypothetical protein [bacterium]MBU1994759.1 hypothetical protein [bacterium]
MSLYHHAQTKVYSGRIVKTKQVYFDYVINSKTSLCFTSKNKNIDLGPIDLYGNVDKAANLLKSFF